MCKEGLSKIKTKTSGGGLLFQACFCLSMQKGVQAKLQDKLVIMIWCSRSSG